MNSIVFLIFSLLAFVAVNGQSTASSIVLQLFSGSNAYFFGVAVQNANADTASISIKDRIATSWAPMTFNSDWGYWSVSTPSGNSFQFPISLLLTSVSGQQLATSLSSLSAVRTNTALQYGTISSVSVNSAPVQATSPPAAPVQATSPPAAPVQATSPPVHATSAPIQATSTPVKSTTAPVQPTTAQTVKATPPATVSLPTAVPAIGCSAPVKLLVPLYSYPGAGWDLVASGAALVHTVAILNLNSGPGKGPDSNYNTYMAKLHSAGVEMVGYVHTSYGARDIADVKADIAKWASEFPLLSGIFIDESAATSNFVQYYTQIYQYIMSFPGWKYDIINPGTVTTAGYLQASTQIVAFEAPAAQFSASDNPSFASCATKDRFAMIAFAGDATAMRSSISAAKAKGYYGWVYVTDGPDGDSTYDVLTSYYAAQASYIQTTINI